MNKENCDVLSDVRNGYGEKLDITRSDEISKDARALIAGFTQSMMKRPEQFALGKFPVYLKGGDGTVVTDVDNNRYIDFICGLGANTLGHNHPSVTNAIMNNLKNGLIHSLPTELEVTTAKKLLSVIPGAEMCRFFKTGADATSAAVRLSRHVTGRDTIITVGYNGWHDHFMFYTPGVPQAIKEFTHRMPLFTEPDEIKLFEKIDELGDSLAAVLLSVPYNRVLEKDFVKKLRERCTANGTIFVFDEIVTGFRIALGGAQEFYGVEADLITLSKGLAAGMPLSAIVGKDKYMRKMEELQVSTTFGGEMLSLEVCSAAISEYRENNSTATMAELGKRLKDGVNEVSQELGTPLRILGYDAIPLFAFTPDMPKQAKIAEPFVAEMAKRGVILRRDVNFISAVHTEEQIDYTIKAVKESLIIMKEKNLFAAL